MPDGLEFAGRDRPGPARGRHRSGGLLLLGSGVAASALGMTLLLASVAPMWGVHVPNSWTVAAPAQPSPQPSTAASPSARPTNQVGGVAANGTPSIVDGPVNGVAFTMRVPALNYTATVVEGVDAASLENGPGHYPTTAWPGRPGTVGIAAHNVYWIAFSRLAPGDLVEVTTRMGVYAYEITGSKITDPGDRSVLAPTAAHRLVMTTCYPLWAGALATQRFIVFARELRAIRPNT